MNRKILILLALLVIQVAIIAIVYWPQPSQIERAPVLADVSADDIVALAIRDGEGNELRLQQQGGSWFLPDAGDYPALEDNVRQVLNSLLLISTDRLITQTPASQARLQVADDDFVRRIELETTDGRRYTVYLGSSPQAGASHFRLAGENEVYLTNALSSFDVAVQPGRYIDTSYVNLTPGEMVALQVENAQGQTTLLKDDDGAWTIAGLAPEDVPDSAAIQNLVNRVAGLSLTRPLSKREDPSCRIESPIAVVTITTSETDGATTQILQVGDAAEEGQVLVNYTGATHCGMVAEFSVTDLLTKTSSDYSLAPTPLPGEDGLPPPQN